MTGRKLITVSLTAATAFAIAAVPASAVTGRDTRPALAVGGRIVRARDWQDTYVPRPDSPLARLHERGGLRL